MRKSVQRGAQPPPKRGSDAIAPQHVSQGVIRSPGQTAPITTQSTMLPYLRNRQAARENLRSAGPSPHPDAEVMPFPRSMVVKESFRVRASTRQEPANRPQLRMPVSVPAPNVIHPQSPATALIFPPSRSPLRARPPARANYPACPVYGTLNTTKGTSLVSFRYKNAVRNWP